jgi:hypothetical protein
VLLGLASGLLAAPRPLPHLVGDLETQVRPRSSTEKVIPNGAACGGGKLHLEVTQFLGPAGALEGHVGQFVKFNAAFQ